MAKYDHGGGCPCGLYSSCLDNCEWSEQKQSTVYIVEDKMNSVIVGVYKTYEKAMEHATNHCVDVAVNDIDEASFILDNEISISKFEII